MAIPDHKTKATPGLLMRHICCGKRLPGNHSRPYNTGEVILPDRKTQATPILDPARHDEATRRLFWRTHSKKVNPTGLAQSVGASVNGLQ